MKQFVIAITMVLASIQFAVGQQSIEECVSELNELFSPKGLLNNRTSGLQTFYIFGVDGCDLTLTIRQERVETSEIAFSCIYRIHAVGLDTSAVVGEKQSLGGLGSRFQLKVSGRGPGHMFVTVLHSEKGKELNRPQSRNVLRIGRWDDPQTYPDLNRVTRLLKMVILKIHASCSDTVKQENDNRLNRIYQEHIEENQRQTFGIQDADIEDEMVEDEMVEDEMVEEVVNDNIHEVVEEYPEFPGGKEEYIGYVEKNIRYPALAKDAGISGKVYVQFVVQKDGSISDARVARGMQKDCDEEALRLIRSMPNWIPGKHRGQKVPVRTILPVKFSLD